MHGIKVETEYRLFQIFCRMKSTDSQSLLNQTDRWIAKRDTPFEEAIPAEERLMFTLPYLATVNSDCVCCLPRLSHVLKFH